MKIIKDIPTIYYEALKQRVFEDDKDRSGFDYSITELNQSPKAFWLKKRHYDEIEVLASDLFYRLRGSALHAIIERVVLPNLMHEQRLFAQIAGKTVSGKYDIYIAELIDSILLHKLQEVKNVSVWTAIYKEYDDWTKQLNGYAHLMVREGYPVDSISVLPAYRDWKESEFKRKKDYPPIVAEEIELPLWDTATQKQYLEERINLLEKYKNTPDNDIPECSPKERWERLPEYAVIKGKAHRATRVFDTKGEAEQYIAEHPRDKGKVPYGIEFRKGRQVKCERCDARAFCGWYQRWLEEEI